MSRHVRFEDDGADRIEAVRRRKVEDAKSNHVKLRRAGHREPYSNDFLSREELADLPYWTPEQLAMAQFYAGNSIDVVGRRVNHRDIDMLGIRFVWDGSYYRRVGA
jgi:hypothetical protein